MLHGAYAIRILLLPSVAVGDIMNFEILYTCSTYYILEFVSFIYAEKYGGINSNMHGTDVLRISLNIPGIVLNVSWETNWIHFFRNRLL